MDPVQLTYLGLFSAASLLLAFLARWCARNQDAHAARAFLAILVVTTGWATTITIQVAFADVRVVQLVTLYASNLLNHLLWISTVLFVFTFTSSRRTLRHPVIVALLAVGVLTELAILTNPIHQLVWSDVVLRSEPFTHLSYQRGPIFFAAYVAGYAATSIAVLHMLREAVRANRFVRRQTAFFTVGVLAASVGNLAYHVGITPVDTTPLGLLVFAVAATVAIYHYRLFEVTPVAYSHVVDEVSNAIVVVDSQGHVAMVNAAATELFGTPEDRFVGESFEDVLPASVCDQIRGGEASAVIEIDGGDADTYRVTTSTVRAGTDGDGIATAAVLEAIPEFAAQRDRLERQTKRLRQQTAQLERQNEQLERFAATVSHDLRNPLNVARGYASMLEEDDVDHADKLMTAFDRMEEIIADVLLLAREGQAIDDREPVAIDEVAADAWASIQAPTGKLAVVTDATIEADPERLRTLFENLFRNSVEHGSTGNRDATRHDNSVEHASTDGVVSGADPSAEPGPGTTTITVDTLDDAEGFLVADDGPGIPDARKPDVFDHGFTTRADGTGFGLSIVQQIAEAHDWRVTVSDAPSGGACFEIRTGD